MKPFKITFFSQTHLRGFAILSEVNRKPNP